MGVTDKTTDLASVGDSRNVRRVRPKPYGDLPPMRVLIHTVYASGEVCGRCHGLIEPDETVYWVFWADTRRPYQGACCTDCAVGPYVTVGETSWPERWSPYRYHGGTCEGCGRHVIKMSARSRLRHFFCSYRCRDRYYTRQRAERRVAARQKTCEVCSAAFTATRSDQKTCSPACKQKAYRQRKKLQSPTSVTGD